MRKLIAGTAVLGAIILMGGCSSVPAPQGPSMELATARENVKIYDVIPQYGTPIEQISATACDRNGQASAEQLNARATDQLILIASQRGGNGLAQQSCKAEGMSFSCWASAICSAMAINVVEPPPPPPPPPKKKLKPRAKPKKP